MTDSSRDKSDAFSKRVRRQVGARIHEFFAATAPGLAPFCLAELQALFPENETLQATAHGVTFQGRLFDLYRAGLHLCTATRILMRVHTLQATNFSELEKQVAAFPWELYLPAGTALQVRVTVHRCRLYHSDAVAQRVTRAVAARLSSHGPQGGRASEIPPQALFVRGTKDRFTLSLDGNGTPLYQRGIKPHGGRAPLRETLAAAVLIRAGFTGAEPLVDPMCGTGTFSLEGAMTARGLPAGGFRRFAFMDWPGFQEGRWRHLKREAEANRKAGPGPPILASDIDLPTCRRLLRSLKKADLDRTVRVVCADFFSLVPEKISADPGLVVINPPYGRRIGSRIHGEDLFVRICDHLTRQWRGWRTGLIAPDRGFARHAPSGLSASPLAHGGLKLTLLTGTL